MTTLRYLRAFGNFSLDGFARIISLFLLFLALAVFASTGAAIPAEPGPEADGVYTCSKTGSWEFEKGPLYPDGALILRKLSEPVELTLLELKGKTYAVYKRDSKFTYSFYPFTTDGKGRIYWGAQFLGGETTPGRKYLSYVQGKIVSHYRLWHQGWREISNDLHQERLTLGSAANC